MALSDPLFNDVGLQLIYPPAESRAALEEAVPGLNVWPEVPGSAGALKLAQSWLRIILRDGFHPPLDAVFVPFPRESGACDVMRTVYQADGLDLEIAQTFCLFNVTIKHFAAKSGEKNRARAERAAMLLLNTKAAAFQTIETVKVFEYGKQLAPYDPFDSDWLELLRWWCEGDRVGFLTVKTHKGLEMSVVGPGKELNTRWFDLYANQ
jgi:hypothetical protein